MIKLTVILLSLSALVAVASAQTPPPGGFVGGCDQYQPGAGGAPCINTGSATYWQPLKGDIVCVYGTPQCSPTNTSQCGKCTVVGINGVPFAGTLSDGQTWCYQASNNTMIPCAP